MSLLPTSPSPRARDMALPHAHLSLALCALAFSRGVWNVPAVVMSNTVWCF